MKNRIFFALPLLLFVVAFFNFRISSADTGSMVDIELTDLQKQRIREQITAVQLEYPNLNAYIVYESVNGDVVLAMCDEPNYIDMNSSNYFWLTYVTTHPKGHNVRLYKYDVDKMQWNCFHTNTMNSSGKLLIARYTSDFPYGQHTVMYANFSFKSSESGEVFFTQAPLTVGLTSMVATQAAVVTEQANQVATMTVTIAIGTLLSLTVLPVFVKKSLNYLCK